MTTNTFIILESLETGKITRFSSMAKASDYLGRSQGFVASLLRKNRHLADGHAIYLTELPNEERVRFI